MIELGDKVRDKMTGYEGIVICIADWINGCKRPMVQAYGLDSNGKPIEAQSSDERDLEIIQKRAVEPSPPVYPLDEPANIVKDSFYTKDVFEPARTGGPRPNPARTTDPTR